MPISTAPHHLITLRRDLLPDLASNGPAADGAALAEDACALADSEHPSKQNVIQAYRSGIDRLRQILDTDNPRDQEARLTLQQFAAFVTGGLQDGFKADVREHFMTLVHWDFHLFCSLVQKPNLPPETRRQAILNLADGVSVCAPGVAQNIETATRELKALTSGVSQNFVSQLITLIENQTQTFMREHGVCDHPGNEIHYVAAFFNHVAHHFSLPPRTDAFIPVLAPDLLEDCTRHILDTASAERVIALMTEDCLARIQDFYAPSHPNVRAAPFDTQTLGEIFLKFENDLGPRLEACFGPIAKEEFFPPCPTGEDERYQLVSDTPLIARAITRNLRQAGIVDFKAAYVIGEPGLGLKLKQLGENLFYVSETTSGTTEDERRHQHLTLGQFILGDFERGQLLFDQLTQAAITMPAARLAQQGFWEKIPLPLMREMQSAPSVETADALFEQTLSLLTAGETRGTVVFETLEEARQARRQDLVDLLFAKLDAGQLDLDNQQRHTGLELALRYGQNTLARMLIDNMSPQQVGLQDPDGYTALMFALEYQQSAHAQLLIDKMSPAQLSLQEKNGNTALMCALMNKQAELANQLIAQLPPEHLNIQDVDGYTALMCALQYKQFKPARQLIDKLDLKQLRIQNKNGEAALKIAQSGDNPELTRLLRKKTHHIWSLFY